jgi:hypothetical protein
LIDAALRGAPFTRRYPTKMQKVAIMRVKIFAAALVLLPVIALAQSPPAKPAASKLSSLPGLEQFMGVVRANHAKLWLAGKARNWELAAYQVAEVKELLSQAEILVPTYSSLPIKQMVDTTAKILAGPVAELEKAVNTKDFEKFSASFDKLTEACNSCHETAGRGFIVMRRPASSNFSNQNFEPRKQRGTVPK